MVTTSEGKKFKGQKRSPLFCCSKFGTWPQIMQTMAKCKVNTQANMHKQNLSSNSARALRTAPGKWAHDWETLSEN